MPYFEDEVAVPLVWLRKDRILSGHVNIHVGGEGQGKSTQAADEAARVSMGWPAPPYDVMDPTAPEGDTPGQVIIISSDDDTFKQKLTAAGADQSKIFNMSRVDRTTASGNTARTEFSLPRDIPALKAQIQKMGDVRLVIIDNLLGVSTQTIAFNMQFRRDIFSPLEDVAVSTGAAIWVQHHFNKGVNMSNILDRINGSAGIRQAARNITVVVNDPIDPELKVIMSAKHSYSKGSDTLEYYITGDFPDTHVRYKPPLPQVDSANYERVQAYILALLIDAERPLSSQELSTYTRLSHGIVMQMLTTSQAQGAVEKRRGAWIATPAIEAAIKEPDADTANTEVVPEA